MKTSDFYYDLPQELIAQSPIEKRDASRLLIYNRKNKSILDGVFPDILDHISPKDVLVLNTTKVIPARIYGVREETGGVMEFLLLKRISDDTFSALVRPGKRAHTGGIYKVSDELSVEIGEKTDAEGRILHLIYDGILEEILDRVGEIPLPPYIKETLLDKSRYQTVYARESGSAAAPTAGLHFTKELLEKIEQRGTAVAQVLLHVGLGTFRPVSVENVEDHKMHEEYYEVSPEASKLINERRQNGGKIIAVGTTSCRTLETVTDKSGTVIPGSGNTGIFITPGYKFKAVDALITNFHLPESTLLMLISALSSREEMLRAYAHAIEKKYLFFSFGDAMFIE
ncbi:MAG: tRNA preQ1(34) S-adenosylmethionine ribosyltransferase-isomerase QueA [Clostridia bacterium]